jgi:hypothetical protein
MPEHLRALAYVLVLAAPAWFLAGKLAVPVVGSREFRLWRNTWLVTTCLVFLSPSFLVFVCLLMPVIWFVYRRAEDPHWLYIILLFSAPCVSTGFGIPGLVNRIIDLDPPRLLAMFVLLPAALQLAKERHHRHVRGADYLVGLLCLILSCLAFRHDDLASIARLIPCYVIDIFLPYFVLSRAIQKPEDVNKALVAIVVAALPLAAIGVFELWRDWRIYYVVIQRWDVPLITAYLFRDGLLRAATTSVEPIAYGFLCMTAAGSLLALRNQAISWRWRWICMAVLLGGLYASISRGPWLGFALALTVTLLADRRALLKLVLAGVPLLVVVLQMVPEALVARFINLLPFVGTADQGSEAYREQLFEQSMLVIEQHLLFGSKDFLEAPEMQSLIQGQGIIDVVNTYLQVVLEFGLVSLLLFASIFVLLGAQLVRLWAIQRAPLVYYQALLGLLVAIVFTIATTSSVSVIPVIYWSFAGVLAGLARVGEMACENHRFGRSLRRPVVGETPVGGPAAVSVKALRVLGRGI